MSKEARVVIDDVELTEEQVAAIRLLLSISIRGLESTEASFGQMRRTMARAMEVHRILEEAKVS